MELEKKVNKLGLSPLSDEERYELAPDKSKWEFFKRYDYYILYKGNPYFYSTKYLSEHSYKELKQKWKEIHFKTFRTKLDLWSFKLEVKWIKLLYRIKRMFAGG